MLHNLIIYLNQFSQQNYFKIPKVSEYSPKFPIFPQNSQYSRWKFTALKIPGNFASLCAHNTPSQCSILHMHKCMYISR